MGRINFPHAADNTTRTSPSPKLVGVRVRRNLFDTLTIARSNASPVDSRAQYNASRCRRREFVFRSTRTRTCVNDVRGK